MRRRRLCFLVSTTAAILWLFFSAKLAIPWALDASKKLPTGYVLFVIFGIALIPGYLVSAMFLSNLLNARLSNQARPCGEAIVVLICARNEQGNIYQTIQCVTEQDYSGRMEILVVDNASSDDTQAEIRRAIRMLVCETPGKAHALNLGLKWISTRHFLTVDADTLLEKSAVRAIVEKITDTGAACVAGNLLVQGARTWVQKMQIYDYLISIAAIKRYQGSYGATLVAQGAFSAYETRAVRAAGGWRLRAGEDIVLTYSLLAQGRDSLYEPRAVGYTLVPEGFMALCRQRVRWARGMLEGLAAVAPWRQPSYYCGYFEAVNASIVFLDLSYVFGFLAGVALALHGLNWFVGWLTLWMLPAALVGACSVYAFQKKIPGVCPEHSLLGGILFLLFFQPVQSVCSLIGYAQAALRKKVLWK